MIGWKKIESEHDLPAPDSDVIVYTSCGWVTEMHYSSNKYAKKPKPRFEWHRKACFPGVVTHWMPLPEAPKEE